MVSMCNVVEMGFDVKQRIHVFFGLFRKADEGLLSMINNQTPLRKHRIAYG